ncbi:hypothetical protein [Clostridium cellulovorans]|uniref:Capsule polysaccharide biosynthesis protein n=1 Tax=Clostridium cellulovorans (strain ATCC 35296 / DSM 3052 / OCM 3 / 743B) TaxID=573061 RepID=D9SNX6_CLOC7|nr:hypothetical protein [Clostridium cellulovorans]ADL51941.1 protein of unknown function DUF354 [Clostridium cellulovorans 743B]
MNLAFITCFEKTPIFYKISEQLKDNNNIFWISPSSYYIKQLLDNGVTTDKILYLDLTQANNYNVSKEDLEFVEDMQIKTGVSFNSVYYMDRIISNWDYEKALRYFTYVVCESSKFIDKHNIKIITSEITAAHEVLISLVCKYKRKLYAVPQTIRMPSERFAFFDGIEISKVIPVESEISNDSLENICKKIYDIVTVTKEKPFYWNQLIKIPKYDLKFVKRCFIKLNESIRLSKNDASVKPLKYQLFVEKKYLKPFKSFILNRKNLFSKPDYLNEKYIIFTLHKQPESSVDVLGIKYNNQIETIRRLSKFVPSNTKIYVKEHSLAFGERNKGYLEEISKIPGVVMVDPYMDTLELAKHAELIVTITGTIAYEAGIMGLKAVTLIDMYFSKLSTVKYIKSENDIGEALMSNVVHDKLNDIKHIKENILKYSFEGLVGDALNSPASISEKNISNMKYAFEKLISYVEGNDNYA